MGLRRLRTAVACATALAAVCLAACGDDTHIPAPPSATPFITSTVTITQQGNAPVHIDPASVTFKLDDSRSLVVHLTLTSQAATTVTVAVRASLYDPSHALVGDATGGQIGVAPRSTQSVELTGPTPIGTIAAATFEASVTPAPG